MVAEIVKQGPVKKSASETQDHQVYAHIFDAILERRLSPGTKLTEEALGEVFGVSRTVIRSALSRLSHEQIVEFIPHRGAFVAEPDAERAREILDARRLIELAVIERVVRRVDQVSLQLKKLRRLIEQEQDSSARRDHGTAIRLSGEFHLELAKLSANEPLKGFLRSLVPQTSLIIALYESSDGSPCAIDEHGRLLDAIEAKDIKESVRLMGEHLDQIESRLNFHQRKKAQDLRQVFEGKQLAK